MARCPSAVRGAQLPPELPVPTGGAALARGRGRALGQSQEESHAQPRVPGRAGRGSAGPCFGGPPGPSAALLCPFLPGTVAESPAAAVGCEVLPAGHRLHCETLGGFSWALGGRGALRRAASALAILLCWFGVATRPRLQGRDAALCHPASALQF